MTPDIARKLTNELDQKIVSERQVVYILVELRKLLESKGIDREERYRALIFCCDWAVHPKLDRESAGAITLLFDRYEVASRERALGVNEAAIPGLVEFCDLSRFRQQFIEACEQNDIPAHAVRDADWWLSFLTHFSEVVRDCPIEAKADTTTYVTRVAASASRAKAIGILNKELAIDWFWECRDRPYPNTVSSVF